MSLAQQLIEARLRDASSTPRIHEDATMEKNIRSTLKDIAELYGVVDTAYSNVRDALASRDDKLLGRSLKYLQSELGSKTKEVDQAIKQFFNYAKTMGYGVEDER